MSVKCRKCGGPITFVEITEGAGKGKLCPKNLDGSDHWDDCSENQHTGRYGDQYKSFKATYRGPSAKRSAEDRAVFEESVTVGKDYRATEDDGSLPWD